MHVAHAASAQGTFEVRVKDHRDAIGDFAKLIVTIDKIALSPKVGFTPWKTSWKELAAQNPSVDLTQYVGKPTAQIFRASMEAEAFDAFHLKIKTIEPVLKKSKRATNVKNTIGPFKLAYAVRPNQETILIIDLTVIDMSDHPPRGYELSLKGYELLMNGKRIEKVPPG